MCRSTLDMKAVCDGCVCIERGGGGGGGGGVEREGDRERKGERAEGR